MSVIRNSCNLSLRTCAWIDWCFGSFCCILTCNTRRNVHTGDDDLMFAGAGLGESGGGVLTKSTVYINDVCFEVSSMLPFDVREAFGEDAVLVHSSGQPVLTNQWGVTLQPLHHGAFYYLMRTFTPSPLDRTMDLVLDLMFPAVKLSTFFA